MSRFIDQKKNKEAVPVSFGFVGESKATSEIDSLRSFLEDEYPDKSLSITGDVRRAVRNDSKDVKLWALNYPETGHVEMVTDEEYRSRRP